ncbi:glycosyltransferase family 25 protein [Sporormia fimetaria CBS 119925]|uniref:Glycosyltransferase family 25 protein n=1 Tax=Sporormia fimetaria CBS 119925 TaxID=1340428 RepID=A0A6A6V9X5_9PLEO|nr:glycosyltransferase family 25 protein [Sporormia fimetaria CBS 119925]
MRRISIDAFGMNHPKETAFAATRRRRTPWYLSRPRLLTTCVFFAVLYLWLKLGDTTVPIPEDSYALVEDESLKDILNTTLGFQKILVLNLPYRTDRRDSMALAAATSNIKLDYVDGVTGESINQKAYPPPDENIKLREGIKGSWRTHMNAMQRVVEQNLTTALIFEDDVDWDVRVRANLQRFALASRFLSENKESLSSKYKIENVPNTETSETMFHMLSPNGITDYLPSMPLSSIGTKGRHYPKHKHHDSPYGDPTKWDILWIGHCGAGFPRHPPTSSSKSPLTTSNLILTHSNDATVPISKYLKSHPFQDALDPLAPAYPPHTRIYHHATGGTLCTVGYAVSQRGARRLLHQFGLKHWNNIYDAEMGRWCASEDEKEDKEGKEYRGMERVCLTTQPPIFAHHHPLNGESDIGGLGGGYARKYETKYLRYSVRMNLERLVQGSRDGGGLVDQWPDD